MIFVRQHTTSGHAADIPITLHREPARPSPSQPHKITHFAANRDGIAVPATKWEWPYPRDKTVRRFAIEDRTRRRFALQLPRDFVYRAVVGSFCKYHELSHRDPTSLALYKPKVNLRIDISIDFEPDMRRAAVGSKRCHAEYTHGRRK